MKSNREIHVSSQATGAFVAAEQGQRLAAEAEALLRQDVAVRQAFAEIDKVRDFIGSPEKILGSASTKHGEIAEQVEVGVRNARDYLHQRMPSATFEGVGRTAPTDYKIDGIDVQSKFINGTRANLDSVLEHMGKYEHFGRGESYYHIPKDHHEVIEKVRMGVPIEGLNSRTAQKILDRVSKIEQVTGKDFHEVVRPGVSNYSDVQQGRIHQTVDRHEQDVRSENEGIRDKIRTDHQPTLGGMAQAAGIGAAVGAGLRLASGLYQKHKEGRNVFLGELTIEDWKELGVDAGKAALQGGVTGGALYALTNFTGMAAPFAGAFVSSSLGVANLAEQYARGEIGFDEFVDLGLLTCAEGAIVGLATAAGQVLIPIPGIGAVVGAVAGRWLLSLAQEHLGAQSAELAERLKTQFEKTMTALDMAQRQAVEAILARYDRLGDLTRNAFDFETNVGLRLSASVALAEAYGVATANILRTTDELDGFMLA